MNRTQYHATLVIGAAGQLIEAGCQVISATAINGRPWLKAKLPPYLTPEARRHLLAMAWQTPVTIEWRAK
jgi:hypothetical protein